MGKPLWPLVAIRRTRSTQQHPRPAGRPTKLRLLRYLLFKLFRRLQRYTAPAPIKINTQVEGSGDSGKGNPTSKSSYVGPRLLPPNGATFVAPAAVARLQIGGEYVVILRFQP